MFKINLVPEVQEKKQQLSKVNYYTTAVSLSALGVLVIVLVIIGGMLVSNKAMIAGTKKDINELNTNISEYKEIEEMALAIKNGLAGAKQILDGNNDWNKLLPHLEKATPSDIRFTKLTMESGSINASLTGSDVNSLARFVDSYKGYQIASLSGTGVWGENVKISIDAAEAILVPVKSNGTWNFALMADMGSDHNVKVESEKGGEKSELIYTASKKQVETKAGTATMAVNKLFKSVEVTQYQRGEDGINFDAKIIYDGAIIW